MNASSLLAGIVGGHANEGLTYIEPGDFEGACSGEFDGQKPRAGGDFQDPACWRQALGDVVREAAKLRHIPPRNVCIPGRQASFHGNATVGLDCLRCHDELL
jgi:hypothetical protein